MSSPLKPAALLLVLCCIAGFGPAAQAQGAPTVSQRDQVSLFGAATLLNTGLQSQQNIAVTGGIDIGLPSTHSLEPSLEYRATYPLATGSVDSQKSNLFGLRISFPYRLHPYADILIGRGEITYYGRGQQVPGKLIYYTQSSSNIYAPGGGIDLDVADHVALMADFQAERYSTPVAASGHIYAMAATLGIAYRFHFKHINP